MSVVDEIADWARRRDEKQRTIDGWLAIVGRWELGDEPVELPIGMAHVSGDEVHVAGRAPIRIGGSFMHGDQRYEFSRVGGVPIARLRDPQSPAILAFEGIPRFPIDLGFRVDARVVRTGTASSHTYATGAVVQADEEIRLEFELDGPRSLVASKEGGRLFVLFGDATNGESTYGAGRFVYVDWDGGDRAILDFNQAFDPPCALTDFATCPIVPAENRLPIAIRAGEKYPLVAE